MQESEILQLYISRDESAISETARKFGSYCKKIALNVLGSVQDTEECVNDVYLAAWNAIPPEKPAVFGAFLARITRNLAFDRYRARTAQKRGGNMSLILTELDECLPSRTDIEAEYEAGQTAEYINVFLSRLESVQRDIFVRRYFCGEALGSIAASHDISYSKAGSILHRLRGKLKQELEKEGILI
jgi:RNA polymerase sigma-70 factor (ECF subfamily)